MTEQKIIELQKQHKESQTKYTYFLLAVAASAIAFSMKITEGQILVWAMLPLGLSVLFWGTSFFFGCKHISWGQATSFSNYAYLQLLNGSHPDQPPHPQVVEAAVNGVRSAMESNLDKAQFYSTWQFRMLILGSIFFLAWHVLVMVLETIAT